MMEPRYYASIGKVCKKDLESEANALLDQGWELLQIPTEQWVHEATGGQMQRSIFILGLPRAPKPLPEIGMSSMAGTPIPAASTPVIGQPIPTPTGAFDLFQKATTSAMNMTWRAYPKFPTDAERVEKGKHQAGFGFVNTKEGAPDPDAASLVLWLKTAQPPHEIAGWEYKLDEEKGLINRKPKGSK